ncbi:hypothetical protein GCM10028805_22750 [Spirosoma harenae]
METNAVTQVLTLNRIGDWNKKDLTELAKASVDEVAENGEDTLALLAMAAKLEHFAGEVKKAAKDRGITDLAKYDKSSVAKGGVQLALKETGVNYDYSNDPVWSQLDAAVKLAEKARKEHEELLKKLPSGGMGLTHPETGETYLAYRPLRTAKESITATIL